MEQSQKYLKIALFGGVYTLKSSLAESVKREDWVWMDYEYSGYVDFFNDKSGRFITAYNGIANGAVTIKKDLAWFKDNNILNVPERYKKVLIFEEGEPTNGTQGENMTLYEAMELAIKFLEERHAKFKRDNYYR